jgi:nucleoside-diphosphate-sugar epimerase
MVARHARRTGLDELSIMATLLCFGLGYCAEHFVAAFGQKFERVVGTVRSPERAAIRNAYDAKRDAEHTAKRSRTLVFDGATFDGTMSDGTMSDGTDPAAELQTAAVEADYVLISAPPGASGDPVLTAFGATLNAARRRQAIVYLSTVGIYGDHGGAWVDEATPPDPNATRSRERLAAEQAWQALGARTGMPIAILRLAGIYGPGQNALVQVARGQARRIVKPGQVFNRIHVGDIAQAIDAAFSRRASGIFNIADDEPAPPGDPIAFAAELLGVAVPPEIAFADAAASMSSMALSFWQDCRRVRNAKLKRELGVRLLYPSYREGLRALSADLLGADLLSADSLSADSA